MNNSINNYGSLDYSPYGKNHAYRSEDSFLSPGGPNASALNETSSRDDLAEIEAKLSVSDKRFLGFISKTLENCLKIEDGIALTPTPDLQLGYDTWLKKSLKNVNLEKHSVDEMITSLWKKSRDFFIALCKQGANTALISNELKKQNEAEEARVEYQAHSLGTKTFTQREVQLLSVLASRNPVTSQ